MDNAFEEEYVSSEDEDNEFQHQTEMKRAFSDDEDISLQNQNNEPWQCGLSNPKERVLALFKNGNFTDIILTFPETELTYDAHRLILAISSPVFESILYGPMRIEGRNVLLHDDDPLLMKYVIAHCYGEDLVPLDMDMALELYKLADKYLLDSLKKECCEHIVNQTNPDNTNDVIEFAERFNFDDLKSNSLPLMKKMFEQAQTNYEGDECYDKKSSTRILMDLSDDWIEGLLSEVSVKVLDFQESWKYPESLSEVKRLNTILSSIGGCYLEKFYGCIDAEIIHHFPLAQIPKKNSSSRSHISSVIELDSFLHYEALELCLSVTDPNHAKRVIEAINQKNRFENNLIAIHIRCEEVWPRNWSPIKPERTHRPSLLLISDADDGKASWVIEAAKSFLPQCEGSYSKMFRKCTEIGKLYELKPVNILIFPRSRFTPNGFIQMLHGLSRSGVKCNTIIVQSPDITNIHKDRIYTSISTDEHGGFNTTLQCIEMDCNLFRKVFEVFPYNVG